MILMSVEGISFLAQVVLCILFYNFLNLNWLLYLGWAILVAALVLAWRARVAFEAEGGSGEGESWLHTRTVVATGIYAVVRHPMYLSFLLMSLSLVLLSQHWLNAVLGAAVMGLLYNDMRREEKSNLERFGKDYQRYMEHVPRMNFVAGAIRLMQSRNWRAGCLNGGGNQMHYVAGALLLAQFALIWVLDDSVDIKGLQYLAWAVWLVAAILLAASMLTLRRRGQVQEGRSCVETEALITTGVYALVRHPLYLGWMLMYVAMVLFKPNWILAILGIAGAACVYRFTVQEEALLKEKFGESYRRYTQAVPRFNLVAGAIRQLLKRCLEDRGT
jgi:protein-S-isoprenylcysteine O-methyltransferase Ste14